MLDSFLLLMMMAIIAIISSLFVLLHKVKDVEHRINSGEVRHWSERDDPAGKKN